MKTRKRARSWCSAEQVVQHHSPAVTSKQFHHARGSASSATCWTYLREAVDCSSGLDTLFASRSCVADQGGVRDEIGTNQRSGTAVNTAAIRAAAHV